MRERERERERESRKVKFSFVFIFPPPVQLNRGAHQSAEGEAVENGFVV